MTMERFDGYAITPHPEGFGNVMILESVWRSVYLEAIVRHAVKVICLTTYNGWLQSSISFLLEAPFLEGVEIISENVSDLRPLLELTKLKKLALTCKAETAIDLSRLKNLRSVFLTWRSAYRSIYDLRTLIRINIVDYPEKDLKPWKENN